jgi:hypothetical protein
MNYKRPSARPFLNIVWSKIYCSDTCKSAVQSISNEKINLLCPALQGLELSFDIRKFLLSTPRGKEYGLLKIPEGNLTNQGF